MSLARNLGLFFGHIAKAVTSDPSSPRPSPTDTPISDPAAFEVARRELSAQTVINTPQGPREVTLRRTVIDRIENVSDANP